MLSTVSKLESGLLGYCSKGLSTGTALGCLQTGTVLVHWQHCSVWGGHGTAWTQS